MSWIRNRGAEPMRDRLSARYQHGLKPGAGDANQRADVAPHAVKIDLAGQPALIVGEQPAADGTAGAHYRRIQAEGTQYSQPMGSGLLI